MVEDKPKYSTKAMSLVRQTLPYLGVNAVVYGVFFVASLIWFSVFGGLAFLIGTKVPVIGVVLAVIALGAFGGLLKWAQRYVLYMVKGAHISAMTELIKGGTLPDGKGQFEYGKEVVQTRFKDVSVLFALDVLIDGALRALQRSVLRIASWLPLPQSANGLIKIATSIMNRSLTYVDEAILSYAVYREEENVWNSARHGIILYAQCYKPILITAAKVWLLGRVLLFLVFLLYLAAFGGLAYLMGSTVATVVAVILAFIAAWSTMAIFFEPFALAYTLTTFHYEIAGVVPNPEWEARLGKVSSKFRELVGKAKEHGADALEFTPAPAPGSVAHSHVGTPALAGAGAVGAPIAEPAPAPAIAAPVVAAPAPTPAATQTRAASWGDGAPAASPTPAATPAPAATQTPAASWGDGAPAPAASETPAAPDGQEAPVPSSSSTPSGWT